ncbi:DNA-directed RNA polymerase II subunit RPB1-like, partial [Oxyura jamaicensis]|uniref:DNA-directed RNA polymerase II subunit RPB1-like n=1 Tax=Oxyura jamaicensis TaxID=8884 RepID=UPI0015A5AEBE
MAQDSPVWPNMPQYAPICPSTAQYDPAPPPQTPQYKPVRSTTAAQLGTPAPPSPDQFGLGEGLGPNWEPRARSARRPVWTSMDQYEIQLGSLRQHGRSHPSTNQYGPVQHPTGDSSPVWPCVLPVRPSMDQYGPVQHLTWDLFIRVALCPPSMDQYGPVGRPGWGLIAQTGPPSTDQYKPVP